MIVNDSTIVNYTVKPGCWILRDIGDIDNIQSQDSTYNIVDKDALTKSLESYIKVFEIDITTNIKLIK